MAFARINGTDLYYESHGEGLPLVLSHGIGSNHLHWWQQIPEFSRRFRVIAFDHRGFGFSADTNGLGPRAFVDDLEALLAHLDIERAVLCGQSMGGLTAGGFASRHPQRVAALVLSCSGGGFFPVAHSEAFRQAVAAVRTYEAFSRLSIEQDGFPQRQPALRFLFESLAQLNHGFDMTRLPDLRTLVADVQPLAAAGVPALLIGGEDDNGANAALERIHAALPGSAFHVLPEVGHLLFFEAAAAYNRLVLDFLESRLGAR